MLSADSIPARNLQRSYKSIIEGVKTKKRPVVLTTNSKPQAAIIPLEDLERLKVVKSSRSALDLLKLAVDNKEKLKSLPADLRQRANEILYSQKGKFAK